jgi:hypothetical protein
MLITKPVRTGGSPRRSVSCALRAGTVALLLSLTIGLAGQVTERRLRDAILEGEGYTAELDINSDGKLDVADLVAFLSQESAQVSFESSFSEATEDAGVFTVTVLVTSKGYAGPVDYTIEGTATNEVDFNGLTGTINVKGSASQIPFAIADDLEVEDVETITLTLQSGSGYNLGARPVHTVYVGDNDAVWEGGLSIDDLYLGFELSLARDSSSYQAAFSSDGYGFFPKSNVAVAEGDLTVTGDLFTATIGPIQHPENARLGTAFESTIFMSAQPNAKEGHVLDWYSAIVGEMTLNMTATAAGRAHLSRDENHNNALQGTFTLIRRAGLVSAPEVELFPVGQ